MTEKEIYKAFIEYNGDCESGILRDIRCSKCLLKTECDKTFNEVKSVGDENDHNYLKRCAEEKLFKITFDEEVNDLLAT